jgi:hypothetical protein
MNPDHIVLCRNDYQRLTAILARVQKELRAHVVVLINRGGHQIACVGASKDIDLTALASLAAANLAATDGLARVVGEVAFSVLHHQGAERSIHISALGERFSLVLVFYEPVPVGVVRWKLQKASVLLDEVFRDFSAREARPIAQDAAEQPAPLFTDEDIERLLGR